MWTCHMWSNCFVCNLYESLQSVQTSNFHTAFLHSWYKRDKDSLFVNVPTCMNTSSWQRLSVTALWHPPIIYPQEENIQSIICSLEEPGHTWRGEQIHRDWRVKMFACEQRSLDVSRHERLFETRPTATNSDVFECPRQQLGSAEKQIGTVGQGFLTRHSTKSQKASWGRTVRDANWPCWQVPAWPPAAQEPSERKHRLNAAPLQRHEKKKNQGGETAALLLLTQETKESGREPRKLNAGSKCKPQLNARDALRGNYQECVGSDPAAHPCQSNWQLFWYTFISEVKQEQRRNEARSCNRDRKCGL